MMSDIYDAVLRRRRGCGMSKSNFERVFGPYPDFSVSEKEDFNRFFSNDEEMQKRRNLFNKTDLREARKDKNTFKIKQRISQQTHKQ